MIAYIGRRLLLMVPTLLGVLTLTFIIMQFVPGGPVEQVMARLQGTSLHGESTRGGDGYHGNEGVDPVQVAAIRHELEIGLGIPAEPLFRSLDNENTRIINAATRLNSFMISTT